MKNLKIKVIDLISYFFIMLFCYAGISKLMDFENFQLQILSTFIPSAFLKIIPITIIISEFLIAGLLCYKNTRNIGLIGSFTLMSIFTSYIIVILSTSENLPCSCGGILEKMSWHQHLYFNIGCIILSVVALVLNTKYSRPAE